VSIDTTLVSSGSGTGFGGLVEGAGTGMILTAQGEVLTNNHVVAGATSVTVTLFGQSIGRPAHVIGTDPAQDLALVQIDDAHNLPTVVLGDSAKTQVGDDVLAIGNALALAGGPSVTEGIISAEGRTLSAQSDISGQTETLTGLLQTDAAINPGNSGGPLVDAAGQVIAMNTAVAESSAGNAPAQNIGFAIPIDLIKPQLTSLQTGGSGGPSGGVKLPPSSSHTAYMGVIVETVTPASAKADHLTPTSGALVVGLTPGGPAETAGIAVNDVIVSVAGTPITSVTGLSAALGQHQPGQTVAVGVYRGPVQMTVQVTLASVP
jgi:S1-C subfamily serine protease